MSLHAGRQHRHCHCQGLAQGDRIKVLQAQRDSHRVRWEDNMLALEEPSAPADMMSRSFDCRSDAALKHDVLGEEAPLQVQRAGKAERAELESPLRPLSQEAFDVLPLTESSRVTHYSPGVVAPRTRETFCTGPEELRRNWDGSNGRWQG